MIIMLCTQCQAELYIAGHHYFGSTPGTFWIEYQLRDENGHFATITGNPKQYNLESAEARVIQYLIEQTQRMRKALSNDKPNSN